MVFAQKINLSYSTATLAKSSVGIQTPNLENRQPIRFVYGGLLRAAHVAGRFYFRGSLNPLRSTAISFRPDGGNKEPEKIGWAMLVIYLSALLRNLQSCCRMLGVTTISFIERGIC